MPELSAAFASQAADNFRFLIDEGFVGPGEDERRLLYISGEMSVEVLFDDRDGRVITIVEAFVGDRTPRAGLPCLYVEAGLGPAQRVRDIARSSHSLAAALASQADALQLLLPVLRGPDAGTLLLGCHGR